MTLRLILAAAAIGMAGLTAPALADPGAPQATSTPDAARAIDPKTDQRRVCIVSETTGSRLPIKTCKPRAAWIAEGVDPLAK